MKTRILSLILIFALLLSAFAGCGVETETPTGSSGQSSENDDAPAETEPDYSWFSMPEETEKLIVYADAAMGNSVMTPAIRFFEELYPGVEVEYKTMSEDEFQSQIRTEIPAGRGPDLLLFTSMDIPDIYKTMTTGLFTDLNPYFALDDSIDLDEFIVPVMDGGVQNGQRFFTPLNYQMPLLVTAQSTLDEIGMSADELNTCDGFFRAAELFHEKYPESTLFIDTFGGALEISNTVTLYSNLGFDLIDYDNNEIRIEEEQFRRYVDLVKKYYNPNYDPSEEELFEESEGWFNSGWAIHTKNCLFDDFSVDLRGLDATTWRLRDIGDEMVMLAQRNLRGGITATIVMNTAIPTGAKNKLNAWRLMKILLSHDIQGGHDETRFGLTYFWTGFPVRRDSLRDFLWMEGMEEDDVFMQYMDVVQSPTEALMLPRVYRKYLSEEILPYVRGERSWEDAYKRFLNTLELYKDE